MSNTEWLGISIFLLFDVSYNFCSTSDITDNADLCKLGGTHLEHHCSVLLFFLIFSPLKPLSVQFVIREA